MIRSKTVASCYNLLTFGYAEPLSSFFNVIFPSRSLNSAKEVYIIWRYNTKEYFIIAIVGSNRRGRALLSALSHEIDCKRRIQPTSGVVFSLPHNTPVLQCCVGV